MATRPTFERFDEAWASRITGRKNTKGIDGFLGIEVERFEPGLLVAGFDVRDDLITMIGNMHGGCIAALVDHCLGVILYPVMGEGYWAATTEFKLNYLAPVSGGRVRATGEIISMTSRLAVVRFDVENELADGKTRLVCVAQGTSTIVAPRS